MNKLSKLVVNSAIVAFFFFIDKVLAFVRARIIAVQYADSVGLLDTFNAANNLPDVLFALISGGALAMAFIPLLTEYLVTRDRAAAWDLFSRVANVAFVLTSIFAVTFVSRILFSSVVTSPETPCSDPLTVEMPKCLTLKLAAE